MGHTNWQRTRDILISTICIGIILWALWDVAGHFVDIIVILLVSMAVAFLLTPIVNLLVKRSVPRLLATAVVFLIVVAVIGAIGSVLVISLIRQIQAFSSTVINYFNQLPDLNSIEEFLQKQAGIPSSTIDEAISQLRVEAVTYAQLAATNAINIVFFVTSAFLNVFLVAVLSFYFLLDGKRLRDSIVSIVPQRQMQHILVFEDALNRVVGNYIRGQLTLAALVGVMAALVCLITGLGQFAIIVGVLAFLFETIPMVGPALASIPAISISLLLPDPFPRTVWVVVLFIAIQLLESNILGPRIVGHAVGLHPVASILSLLVFAQLFGPFGALIATPLVAAGWVVITSIYRSARGETPEQMLMKKRAPWQIRRPTAHVFSRRHNSNPGIGSGSMLLRPSADGSGNVGSEAEADSTGSNGSNGKTHVEIDKVDSVQVGKEADGKQVVSIDRSQDA